MKNLKLALAAIFLLGLSTSFAKPISNVQDTISKIELKKNAKCTFVKASRDFCINGLCFNSQTYKCVSNSEDFGVKLKLKSQVLFDGTRYTKVRKVIYLK